MIEAGIAVAILAGAVLLFGGAVLLGLALGRRLDRILVARAVRDDAAAIDAATDVNRKEVSDEQ